LAQQAEQPVPDVLPAPILSDSERGRRSQAEGVVQLSLLEQAGVAGDPGPVELEL